MTQKDRKHPQGCISPGGHCWRYILVIVRSLRLSLGSILRHKIIITLHWRHDERDGVSNHQRLVLFAQRFVQAQIKESIKAPLHWPLWGESTGDRWIPLTKGSNAENVSIWWCQHAPKNPPAWYTLWIYGEATDNNMIIIVVMVRTMISKIKMIVPNDGNDHTIE